MHPRTLLPHCWSCADPATPESVEHVSILQPREAEFGGPFRWYACPNCGVRNGVLASRRGGWILYPLEGREEGLPADWLLTGVSRTRRQRARAWWRRNADVVAAFRNAGRTDRHPSGAPDAPSAQGHGNRQDSPPPRPTTSRAGRSEPPPRPRASRPPPRPHAPPPPAVATPPGELDDPAALLGVAPGASAREIRRAYREAVKRSHPDRVAHMDPVFHALAHERMKALRRAYELLSAASPRDDASTA